MIDIYFFSRMPGTIIASIIGLVAGLLYSKPDWGLRRVSGESGRVEKKIKIFLPMGQLVTVRAVVVKVKEKPYSNS